MVKRRSDGIYDKRSLIMAMPRFLHHMSPLTRTDNDASLMFFRQDKKIRSDKKLKITKAHIALSTFHEAVCCIFFIFPAGHDGAPPATHKHQMSP